MGRPPAASPFTSLPASPRATIAYQLAAWITLFACQPTEPPVFRQLPASQTGITFSNTLEENEQDNVYEYINFYTGAGVAAGDINNDGLADLYFSGNQVPGRLYLNRGDLQFEDVSASAGVLSDRWGTGATMVDINGDGWLDIYVCVSGNGSETERANLLYINQGDSTGQGPSFVEQAAAYGLADPRPTMHASFFDYDLDGDLDLFMIVNSADHTSQVNTVRPRPLRGATTSTDILYRNDLSSLSRISPPGGRRGLGGQGGGFTEVSPQAGIITEGYSLGLAVSDINQDGWPDIYVSNDFVGNDVLYINQRDGTFADEASRYFKHTSYAGMGNDVADFNNDGLVDIIELDMRPEDNYRRKLIIPAARYDRFQVMLNAGYDPQYTRNTLQLNRGNGTFSEISFLAGVSSTDWSWSSLLADYDNDGDRDLFVTNGFLRDLGDLDYINYQSTYNNAMGDADAKRTQKLEAIKQLKSVPIRDYLFANDGDLTFTDRSSDWGIEQAGFSNGAVYVDLDNDGDLELVVNNINEAAHVYENQTSQQSGRHFLRVKLVGPELNPNGIGTKLWLRYGGRQQYYEHFLNRGYESAVDPVAHFGLDSVAVIDSVEIRWPDGKYQLLRAVVTNQTLTVAYRDAEEEPRVKPDQQLPLFCEVASRHHLTHQHQENEQVDFKVQPLLPHMHSREGPYLAVGDVNGDAWDDLYVGGAAGFAGVFKLQQADGTFRQQSLPYDSRSEDTGVVLFDADNDGDQDLYVVSGGTAYPEGDERYQDRLYLNDGAGTFETTSALPNLTASGSVVIPSDYDHDGDLDLFVGGRVVPGAYPMPPRSYLLRNDTPPRHGTSPERPVKFTDVTEAIVPELVQPGLVTAALWTDYDGDGWEDLLVTGEFMSLRFFRNDQGKLKEATEETGLSSTHGWWNCLAAGDFDDDGDTDYLAGNLGLNSRYRATPDEPLCVYASDYDKNGSIDPVMCYYVQGKNYLAHARDELNAQINPMRARFTTYADYARVPFDEAFLPEELNAAYVVRSERFASSYVENLGDGTFAIRDLPIEAQVAPVNGIAVGDYDGNGTLDALLVGNDYTADVATGRYDASEGWLLRGDGKGDFAPMGAQESGFLVNSDARSVVPLTLADGRAVVGGRK